MSLNTKNISSSAAREGSSSNVSSSRPGSSSRRPLSGIPTKSKPSCKVVGAVKKLQPVSKLQYEKEENSQFSKNLIKGNTKCLFYELDDKDVDFGGLSQAEIDDARQTGVVKLSRKSLLEVPDIVWSIELPTEEDRKSINVRFDGKEKEPWWTFKPLEYLDASHNSLKSLTPKGSALYSLKELYVNSNSLTTISEEIGKCKEIRVLTLDDNKLSHLPESFSNLTNLVELKLQKNYLVDLPKDFGNLVNLKNLDFSCNKFEKIPYDIGYLTGLIELNMSHNQIAAIPEELQNLRTLKLLDVSNNNLQFIPSLNDMPHLTQFIGNNNHISDFPNFCSCRRLTEINLNDNKIKELLVDNLQGVPLNKLLLGNNELKELPGDISRLTTLVLLDLSNNELTRLPYQLVWLRNLSLLKVDFNPIEGIRQDILKSGTNRILAHLKRQSKCESDNPGTETKDYETVKSVYEKKLDDLSGPLKMDVRTTRCLILTNMDLSEISPDVLLEAKAEEVFRVDLSKNQFSSIPDGLLTLTQNLTEIIIRQNNLREVPDFIGDLKNLLYLDVSNNKLESLPTSMKTCILKALIAECNCFSEIPEVVYSINPLEHVNFRDNKITEINVGGLKNLKYLYLLDLSNNSIEKVPPELGYLTQIKELQLYGNPFKLPRYSLLCKGTDAVMAYLRDKTANHDCI